MSELDKKVIVRMAPSPTGYFHIGSVRTALFNFLFARKHNGTFIFRSEDTNTERSKKEYEENITESITWLGLSYDIFMRQSERTDMYVSYLKKMLQNGSAYISHEDITEEKSEYSKSQGEKRTEVIRLKNPNKKIVFDDLVRGRVEFDTTESGDFVIAKSLTEPLYHLAVVVDDYETGATHIIRGEDILSSTPRQILIQEAIGAPRPIYAHIPLILAPDRSKLSKRYGATSLVEYQKQGFLPAAILNYMALLGWNPGTEQEIFTLEELIEKFDISRVQKGGAIFDMTKMLWVNKEHIKRLPQDDCAAEIIARLKTLDIPNISQLDGKNFADKLCKIILEYINVWGDIDTMHTAGELTYFFEQPKYLKENSPELLFWKKDPDATHTKTRLEKIREIFSTADEKYFDNSESVKNLIWNFVESEGKSPDGKIDRGLVLWPLRTSLSGMEKSPDPFTLASLFGKSETLNRLDKAIQSL